VFAQIPTQEMEQQAQSGRDGEKMPLTPLARAISGRGGPHVTNQVPCDAEATAWDAMTRSNDLDPNDQDTMLRVGDGARVLPLEGGEDGLDGRDLFFSDKKNKASTGADELGGNGEGLVEALYGPEGDGVEGLRDVFGARGLDFDVRELERANHLPKEGRLLLVRFDERDMKLRSPELDGEAGEASAGAYVG
jgi:hypothetical protein